MKITIPVSAAKNGGNLYTLVDDLTNTNSGITKQTVNTDLLITDDPSIPVNMDQANLLAILAEAGEVEERLMAIKMPTSFANTAVPVGVPYRENVIGNARQFDEWFLYGAEVWIDSTNGFFVFNTNPLGSVAAQSQYLKGSQMEIIRQLDAVNISILNLEEAQTEVDDPAKNYVKVVWQ
jgi:hypothetical protein